MPTSPPELILGLDVGGTNTTAALGTPDGEILTSVSRPSRAGEGFAASWAAVVAAADEVVAKAGADHGALSCVGVSIGGPVDQLLGVVYSPPNLPGWDDVPLSRLLTERFGVPAYVEHDAKAGALAEWRYGAGRGLHTFVFLTLGTGLGAGLIVDNHLLHGRRNNIGEVGHWRLAPTGPDLYGKPGCWEGFSSGAGLARAAEMRYPGRWRRPTAADIFAAARAGDEPALDLVADFGEYLGRGIALLVDLVSPEKVVLGSLAVRAGDLFLDRVQTIVDAECTARNLPCPVAPSSLGELLGPLAAIAVAADRRDPARAAGKER